MESNLTAQVNPAKPWFEENRTLGTDALLKDMQRRISNHLFDLRVKEGYTNWRLDRLENACRQSPYRDPVFSSFPPNRD